MRRLEGFPVVATAALSLAIAPGAWGNLILEFDDFGVHGQVEMFDPVVGAPAGGISFIEPGANDISLVFQLTVFAGSHDISQFGIGINDGFAAIDSTGLGWVPDGAPAWVDVSGFDGTADTRIFLFDPAGGIGGNGNGLLDPGETSEMFFVSYSEGSIAEGMSLSFMITNGGPTFSVKTLIPKVPAPGALGLLLVGAAGLARRRRRS